jgi:hypothetical protein
VTARKVHTMATLAAELDALLPDLTTSAAPTLARTLIRAVGRDHPSAQCVCPSTSVTTDDRNRVLAKARKLYL